MNNLNEKLVLRFTIQIGFVMMIAMMITLSSYGQIEDMKIKISTETDPDSIFALYYKIAEAYEYAEIDSAVTYVKKAIEICPRISNDSMKYKPEHFLGDLYVQKGKYAMASRYFNLAMEKAFLAKSKATIRLSMVSNLIQQDSMVQALKIGEQCEKNIEELDDPWFKDNLSAILHYNMGVIHSGLGHYTRAIGEYLEMKTVCDRAKLTNYYGALYNDLAELYSKTKDTDSALRYYRLSMESIPRDYPLGHSIINVNMGGIFYDIRSLDSALFHYQKVLDNPVSERYEVQAEQGMAKVLVAMGKIPQAQTHLNRVKHKKVSLALSADAHLVQANIFEKQGFYDKGLKEIDKGLEILEQGDNDYAKKNAIEKYFKLYAKVNNQPKLWNKFEDYAMASDSLASRSFHNQLTDIKEKYQSRIKSDSIQMLQVKERNALIIAKKERVNKYISWVLMLLLGGLAYAIFRNFQKEKKLVAILDAENQSLLMINERLKDDVIEAQKKENPFEVLKNSYLTLNDKNKTTIKLADILYLETKNKRLYIKTADTEYSVWSSLTSYKRLLPDYLFIQIHGSYIVNILHVSVKPNHKLIMSNGETLGISRKFLEPVAEKLKEFSINQNEI